MHSATFSNPDVSSTTTVINTNGVTITGGTSGTVSLTSTGLNHERGSWHHLSNLERRGQWGSAPRNECERPEERDEYCR